MSVEKIINAVQSEQWGLNQDNVRLYRASLARHDSSQIIMGKDNGKLQLIVWGEGSLYSDLQGTENNGYKVCDCNHQNRLVLNKYFDYTRLLVSFFVDGSGPCFFDSNFQ